MSSKRPNPSRFQTPAPALPPSLDGAALAAAKREARAKRAAPAPSAAHGGKTAVKFGVLFDDDAVAFFYIPLFGSISTDLVDPAENFVPRRDR